MLIKDAKKIQKINSFKSFDAETFFKDKKLQVHSVVINKDKPYSLNVKILEDNTTYKKGEKINEGQFFKVSLLDEYAVEDIAEILNNQPLIKLNFENCEAYLYFSKLFVNVRSFEVKSKGLRQTIGG